MRWDQNQNDASDVEDRRGEGPVGGGVPVFGILRLFSLFGWKGMIVGLLIAGAIAVGGRFTSSGGSENAPVQTSVDEDKMLKFVEFMFHDVQGSWEKQIKGYKHAHLVVFRGSTRSGCGTATESIGPFYCPNDEKV